MKSFLIIFAAILAGLGALLYAPDDKSVENFIGEAALPAGSLVERKSREIPLGAREYKNEHYGFSVLYPDILSMKEIDEGGGAATIIFQNVEKGLGFQIFIVPYVEKQVSEERFLKDVPSGVRKESKDFQIDGALATGFYSNNAFLGETREVWFIHGSFLYEVTAHRSMETLFAEIIATWKFL